MASRLRTAVVLGIVVYAYVHADAQEPGFDEYQVKAAFLYNFAKYVEWPSGTFTKSNDPMRICIVGQNPFGSTLSDTVQGKKIGDRDFKVELLSDTQQSGRCQIVFIGAGEWKRTGALLEELRRGGILTVGETDDFTSLGGIISLKLDGRRIRIQVALNRAERSRLRISSKLLSLADIVRKQP